MLSSWIFVVGFWLLAIAIVLDVVVLKMQLQEIKRNHLLQPLKKLLLGSVIFIALASIPLAFVYADAIWFHFTGAWLVYLAVIGNAAAKVVVGILLIFIYKYRGKK